MEPAKKDKKRPKREIPPGLVAVSQPGTSLCQLLSDKFYCIACAKQKKAHKHGLFG